MDVAGVGAAQRREGGAASGGGDVAGGNIGAGGGERVGGVLDRGLKGHARAGDILHLNGTLSRGEGDAAARHCIAGGDGPLGGDVLGLGDGDILARTGGDLAAEGDIGPLGGEADTILDMELLAIGGGEA